MAVDFDPYTHPYTDAEIAQLTMRSRTRDLDINRSLFPERYGEAPEPLAISDALNNLPGEFADGHVTPDMQPPPAPAPVPVHCNGFADAPDDVKEEVEPLTVDELKAELEAISVTYEKGDHKAQLRDKLAVAWAAMG